MGLDQIMYDPLGHDKNLDLILDMMEALEGSEPECKKA